MTTAIKRRRGTTAQHATFAGLEGELTIDTTKDTVVVHDGATAGGFPLAKESQVTSNVAITGGTITGITDLAVADGGTGASTASDARTNLGVTTTGADTTYAYRANNLSDLASASTARTNLGLGTAAVVADSTLVHTSGNETIGGTKTFSVDASISGLTVGKGGGAVSTNTAVGYAAVGANSAGVTGANNTGVGLNSLWNLTSGTDNTMVGKYSGISLTSGASNVGVGSGTLYNNTTASNNTAVGYQAAYTQTNGGPTTAIGYQAAYTNNNGNIVAVGYRALYSNSSGYQLVATGDEALYSNTTGVNNTAMGGSALRSNTTASNNTAVGYQAGYSNTTGTEITAIGYKAGYSSITGNYSTYVGFSAGRDTTGGNNTFIGDGAGIFVTSGSKNTIIGTYGGNNGGLDIRTSSNYIVLSDGDGNPRLWIDGSGNIVQQNNANQRIYSQGVYNVTGAASANMVVGSDGGFYRSTSSLKYKQNVKDSTHGLSDLLKLRSVTYESKNDNEVGLVFGGLIAEEVDAAGLKEFVQYAEDGSPDSLAYGQMVSLCIKAIQELNAKLEAQALEIATLKGL